jgi:hypothetical protein
MGTESPTRVSRGVSCDSRVTRPSRPASSNRAKMYSSVLYAMLTAHCQRREVLAGQRAAEGAEPRVVPPRAFGHRSVALMSNDSTQKDLFMNNMATC